MDIVTRAKTEAKENRKHPRRNIHQHALIGYRGVFLPGVALNMSQSGLLVRVQQPPKVLPAELNVYLSDNRNKTMCLPAQVAYISGSRIGLQLLDDETLEKPLFSMIRPGLLGWAAVQFALAVLLPTLFVVDAIAL